MTLDNTAKVVHFDDEIYEIEKIQKVLSSGKLQFSFKLVSLQDPDTFLDDIAALGSVHCFLLDIFHKEKGKIGIELAKIARRKYPKTVILMRSSLDDGKTIQQCLEAGADDFISKEASHAEILLRLSHAVTLRYSTPAIPENKKAAVDFIVGATMQGVSKRIPRILESAITSVFVGGESGAGKEVVADIVGAHLGKSSPLVRVNCGAIAPSLLESELFGHVKGAFTGAVTDKRGLIEAANGGWIFLDEVATLSKPAQVALLRVLETGDVTRVGDHKSRRVKVKVLSATNENIPKMIEDGEFRQDLWQRLIEARIDLAPLRERRGEIPALIQYFCSTMPGGPYKIAKSAVKLLVDCDWRGGNVRELRNCLRAMTEFQVQGLLTPLGIPSHIIDQMSDPESRQNADEIIEKAKAAKEIVIDNAPAKPEPTARTAQTDTSAERPDALVIECDWETQPTFEDITNFMLIELCKSVHVRHGKLSMRKFSKEIGVSRSAITSRLKGIVQKGLIDIETLNTYISIGEA